jgi:hypothetical protein
MCCTASSHLVERLLRETVRTTGSSVAKAVYANHRTPRCIQGAFLAYFLCTSKESESAAGPKPPPAMRINTRQPTREAPRHCKHGNALQAQQRNATQHNASQLHPRLKPAAASIKLRV